MHLLVNKWWIYVYNNIIVFGEILAIFQEFLLYFYTYTQACNPEHTQTEWYCTKTYAWTDSLIHAWSSF